MNLRKDSEGMLWVRNQIADAVINGVPGPAGPPGPVGPQGVGSQGPAGAAGAAGPNSVSTSTVSTIAAGLVKTAAGHLAQAVANTDYVTPAFAASTYVPYSGATADVDLNSHDITGIADLNFDNGGGGIFGFGDSVAYPNAVFSMSGGQIQDASAIDAGLGYVHSYTNSFFGDPSDGGIEIGANGDCYGLRRLSGSDPLELEYNSNIPGRGARFFGGGGNYGDLQLMNNETPFVTLDTSSGLFTFSPVGGFVINGSNGGATTQLTVSGSSGAGNNAISCSGGQAGVIASGTNGASTAQGVVGDWLFSSGAAFYAKTGSYGIYSDVTQSYLAGKTGFGTITSPAATIDIAAGSTSLLPIKLHSGALLTSPVVGGVEFLTDDIYFTIGTGTARKHIALVDTAAGLTSGRVTFATTNGRLADNSNFTYNGTTLTVNGSGTMLSIGSAAFTVSSSGSATGAAFSTTNGALLTGGFSVGTAGVLGMTSGASPAGSIDTAISRSAAGVAVVGTGAAGNASGTLIAATLANAASPTAFVHAAASTTAKASLRLPSGTAPTAPNHGEGWTDANHLYFRLNGVTYQIDQPTVVGSVTTYNGITLAGAGLSPIVANSDQTGLSAAATVVTYTTPAAAGTYRIGGYLNITAVTLDVIQFQVAWTDEASNSRTQTFFPMGATNAALSSTGFTPFPASDIRVKASTTITVSTVLTTGTGTIAYDVGSSIMQVS